MLKLEKVMPKYFLHLWDGDLFEEDDEGTDLSDPAAALDEALRFAQEIRGDLATPDRALVQVADETGSPLWLLQFSAMAGGATRRISHDGRRRVRRRPGEGRGREGWTTRKSCSGWEQLSDD
jgi:hypothetical protein